MPLTRPKAAQVNFDVTNITDPLLRFNSGQTGPNDKDTGIVLERGDDSNVGLIWDESADEFALITTTEDGTTSGNVTISSYANLQAGTINTSGLTVDTNTLYVDSTNNRVGIGTTSPAVGLDFQMINSEEGFRVRRHNASDQYIEISETDGSRHEIKANGTKEFRIVNTTAESSQGFHFYRNSAERLRILGDGLITFQDGAGTVAFTSDITTNSISQGDSSITVTDTGTGSAIVSLDNATHTTFDSSGITLTSGVFSGTATSAQYADLAEMYAGDKNYEVGTVVCVGGDKEVTECNSYADSKLAGVVSDKPAYLMNRDIEAEYPICVGFVGRVPIKVVGHIEKGDLLTTSTIKGFATKFSQGSYNPGCIIGLSLNDKKDPGEGTVEVLLKRS